MDKLSQYIESLVFVADSPITIGEIKESLESSIQIKTSNKKIEAALLELQEKYKDDQFSFELIGISKGYQFMTKAAYHDAVGQYLKIQSKRKLSRAAMETLAIIAYKQPLTKSGVESIRGVNCDYAVQKLIEKELVEILGRAEGPGRPLLYGTSDKFMDYFGIKDITDLPKLKEIIITENNIGMEQGLEKMYTQGLTDDYKFKPTEEELKAAAESLIDDTDTILLDEDTLDNTAIEGEEVSVSIETHEEEVTSEASNEQTDKHLIEEEENLTTEEMVEDQIVEPSDNTSKTETEETSDPALDTPIENEDLAIENSEEGTTDQTDEIIDEKENEAPT